MPDLQGFIPTPKNGVDLNGILLVSQLLNMIFFSWDVHKLNWWFENSIVELILKIHIYPDSNKLVGMDLHKLWRTVSYVGLLELQGIYAT